MLLSCTLLTIVSRRRLGVAHADDPFYMGALGNA